VRKKKEVAFSDTECCTTLYYTETASVYRKFQFLYNADMKNFHEHLPSRFKSNIAGGLYRHRVIPNIVIYT
jgi:hypothetical protein